MRQPSNWISGIITLLCGGLLGLLMTVAHRATWTVAGWPLPVGIVLGVLGALAFATACRLLWESRIPAAGAAVGVVLAQGVVALLPGGAVFYRADGFDAIDGLWAFLPGLLVIAAVVWPSGRRPVSAGADRIKGPVHVHPGDPQ